MKKIVDVVNLLVVLSMFLALAPLAGAAPAAQTPAFTGQVTEAGSTTVQPAAEKLAAAFMKLNPDLKVVIQGGGSSAGVKAAGEGTVNIGAVSREVSSDEMKTYPDLKVYTFAKDGIAIITNPGVTVADLTKDQIKGIFSGKIANWKEVGGADKLITVVAREEGSGTRTAFEEMVMGKDNPIVDMAILQNSNGAVKTTVASTPDSVGFLSFGYLDKSVKALKVGGVEATVDNAIKGTYPIVRPLSLLTKGEPTGAAKGWLDFIISPEGQAVVAQEGYIAVYPAAGMYAGQVTEAGSTTVQPVAEKLAAAFMKLNPDLKVVIQGGGSSAGVKAAGEGTVNIGAVSREVSSDEMKTYPDLKVYTFAKDGIAIITNPAVTVADLTKDQIKGIFSGKIANWKEVGGADKPITVVAREEGSGTRTAFEEMVMGKDNPIVDMAILQNSNGAVKTTVASTPDSVGFLSFGYLDKSVKALKVGGVEATVDNAIKGTYPIVRPLSLLTKGEPTGAAKGWLDFIVSPAGQAIVAQEGYLALK